MSRLCIAKILNAHGIRGLVKIRIYADDISLVKGPDAVLYRDAESSEQIKITLKNPIKGDYLASVEGVDDRNAAEELRHLEIYMDEAKLPTLDDDEVYHRDLVGLSVIDSEKNKLGTVKLMQNFGAGDLLEIAPNSGNSFYLPFNKDYIVNIDLDEQQVTVQDFEDYLG
jgi:16S rRNA processing protein RimM